MVSRNPIAQNVNHLFPLTYSIHPTAIVSNKAKIAPGVTIGAYSIIGDDVSIGENTTIASHVIIEGWTQIGKRNQIAAGAIIGSTPQDLKFDSEKSFVEIGDDNIIREYVTINRGTSHGGLVTKIGNKNLLMTSSHVAHDVKIGSFNVIANAVLIGGHAVIDNWVTVGGLAGIHQFVRVGSLAMIGANSVITKDVAPFVLIKGDPPRLYGLNTERLNRLEYSIDRKKILKKAYQIIFKSGLTINKAHEEIVNTLPLNEDIRVLLKFINISTRGLHR